ncbi:antibiotic biosynthesis monooxygenase family protein [Deinococcus peraridilitoris]|uniref:Putative enzyme involved in biosynthesis of extracellular polysaccharides n=1 Tax=Deinococcus peraridilitoris (strain DSM 19664 / LMG 22246 / CIP 109416 / KR-200) TaxID=937777 RepID=L0A398_DEIPD|nr:antibiotic biosynthesis monooxygenase [Deinococcus peraridilitoris]AFZ68321.1 putative enzyme involved in biosynthesis of extracellular polysaccharides [Deinococcus peraridilitoris DSM 19664]
MITVANRIYVNPDFAEAFEARFRERAGLVDQMPGFLSNFVLRPTKSGEPYIVLTLWESREAFEGWTQSDAFHQGHARSGSLPREAFSSPNILEIHEVISHAQTQKL